MKKYLAILLALTMLLLTGCSGSGAAETKAATEAPTEAPVPETTAATEPMETEPPAPETVAATILADRTAVVLTTANRGDVLDVVDEYNEEYYVVKLENGYGLVEKRLTRRDSEESYEQWTGYAFYGAKLYADYRLRDPEPLELGMNDQMTVLDSLGDVLVVQMGETVGYIPANQVSTYFVVPAPGGSSGGGGGADGGDIILGVHGGITLLGTFVPQSGEVSGSATVLADETPILLGWFDRGETVELVNEEGFAEEMEDHCTIYLDGLYGYIRQNLFAREGEEPYAEWDGYAFYNAVLYDNYDLMGEPVQTLNTNTDIHVVCDLGDCYLVTVGETTGYMAKDHVSEYYVVYSGGGSSGGGGAEWSDPVL